MSQSNDKQDEIIQATQQWLIKAVIGLNLCPFAKSVHVKNQIRYRVSQAKDAQELLSDLVDELKLLSTTPRQKTDTTLLIHPYVLNDFLIFNDFLDRADQVLKQLELDGIIQIASFHPHYQFADTTSDDVTNYTNRSPYPILHLIREISIEEATQAIPEASTIYEANMKTLRELGIENYLKLIKA